MMTQIRKPKVLNFWVMPNSGFATRPLLQRMINDFEKIYPGIKVELTVHPWSLGWNRLMGVIKGRKEKAIPDVMQIGTTWVTTLEYLGALEKVPADVKEVSEEASSSSIGDASPYCTPWFLDIRVLYYRRDLFDALGLDRKLLDDWKGFYRVCSEIQKYLNQRTRFHKIIGPLAMPGQKPTVLMHDLAPWVWEAGGDFSKEESKEASLAQAPIKEGSKFYFDLINQGFMPLPKIAMPIGNFFTGHYALQFSGSWPVDTYLNPGNSCCIPEVALGFEVAPLPQGPNGRFTFLGGSNLSVCSMSQNKEWGWELVKFLNDPERQLSHARSIGALPARLAKMPELFMRHPNARDVFFNSFGFSRRLPRLIELGSIEQIVNKMGSRVLSLIRDGLYDHKRLENEIQAANGEIKTLLSIHRYGANPKEATS